MNYGYDALGRRTTMTTNGQAPVGYQYDAASRLMQVAQGSQTVGLGYDATGRRTSLTYPNGTSTSYTYDIASRLTNITHQGPAGLIEALSYTYDAAGNRISLTRTNGTASHLPAAVQAAYDAANEQIQFNSASPNQTFDANGNLTTSTDVSGTTTYTWDARNRIVAQAGPSVNATFQYDALGRRASKTINGVTTSYLYDGNDIVQEIGGSAVGASYVRSLNIDEPFVRQMASGNEFYHTDALGSTVAVSNAMGGAVVNYTYEAFGKTTVAGTSSNPFQFTGRENDGIGIYYYRARYYAPSVGRFIREDPLRQKQKRPNSDLYENLYLYAANDPVGLRDPSGQISAGAIGAGTVIGVHVILAYTGWCAYCATPIAREGQSRFPWTPDDRNNHMRHCYTSCSVSQRCGPVCAFVSGWLNELIGVYDPEDVESNRKGRLCHGSPNCEKCCRDCESKPQK